MNGAILTAFFLFALSAIFAYLFIREQRRNDAMHEKVESQVKIQTAIEREWLVAIEELRLVLEQRRTDFVQQAFELSKLIVRVESELNNFSNLTKKIDGYAGQITAQSNEWVLQVTAFQEAIVEIQTELEELQEDMSTKNRIVDSYLKSQGISLRTGKPKRNSGTKMDPS